MHPAKIGFPVILVLLLSLFLAPLAFASGQSRGEEGNDSTIEIGAGLDRPWKDSLDSGPAGDRRCLNIASVARAAGKQALQINQLKKKALRKARKAKAAGKSSARVRKLSRTAVRLSKQTKKIDRRMAKLEKKQLRLFCKSDDDSAQPRICRQVGKIEGAMFFYLAKIADLRAEVISDPGINEEDRDFALEILDEDQARIEALLDRLAARFSDQDCRGGDRPDPGAREEALCDKIDAISEKADALYEKAGLLRDKAESTEISEEKRSQLLGEALLLEERADRVLAETEDQWINSGCDDLVEEDPCEVDSSCDYCEDPEPGEYSVATTSDDLIGCDDGCEVASDCAGYCDDAVSEGDSSVATATNETPAPPKPDSCDYS